MNPERITEKRRLLNMSQKQLAVLAKVDYIELNHWEAGKSSSLTVEDISRVRRSLMDAAALRIKDAEEKLAAMKSIISSEAVYEKFMESWEKNESRKSEVEAMLKL